MKRLVVLNLVILLLLLGSAKLESAEKMKRFYTDDFTITIRGRSLTAAEFAAQQNGLAPSKFLA